MKNGMSLYVWVMCICSAVFIVLTLALVVAPSLPPAPGADRASLALVTAAQSEVLERGHQAWSVDDLRALGALDQDAALPDGVFTFGTSRAFGTVIVADDRVVAQVGTGKVYEVASTDELAASRLFSCEWLDAGLPLFAGPCQKLAENMTMTWVVEPVADITWTANLSHPTGKFTWDDGVVQPAKGDNPTRDLQSGSRYTVTFSGRATGFDVFADVPSLEAVTRVSEWNADGRVDGTGAFRGMRNLVDVPSEVPQLVSMSSIFADAASFNDADVIAWDTSLVTAMDAAFAGAAVFNQPLGDWDISMVNNLTDTFARATAFNQPIGSWNTARLHSFSGMFQDAAAFNQPLADWDVSSAASFEYMFQGASAFGQDLSAWRLSDTARESVVRDAPALQDHPEWAPSVR